VLVAAVASCSMFDYSGIVSRKYALIYGVTTYTMGAGSGVKPNLTYPDSDASAMYSVLLAHGYAITSRWVDPSGNVWLDNVNQNKKIGSLTTSTTDGSVVGGSQGPGDPIAPGKANILADIQALAGTIGPNDVLVVYFSGHGTQDASVTPPREYFDPYGAVMQFTDGKFYDFPVPSVRDDELAAAFAGVRTPRKVLILDTCNSGGFIGNTLEVDATPNAYTGGPALVTPGTLIQAISNYASMQSSPTGLSPYGAQVFSAAGRDELSYETSSFGHGVMSYFLLQGLQGSVADLNHDGHVTVLESFSYAKAGIDRNWNSDAGIIAAAETFEPHISGGPVDFVLF
jgi:hypothetical protein